MRELLCEYPSRSDVLQRAVVVLDRVGEGGLPASLKGPFTGRCGVDVEAGGGVL